MCLFRMAVRISFPSRSCRRSVTRVVLAGNSITADILFAYLKQDSRYQVLACVVDDEYVASGGVEGLSTIVLSRLTELYPADGVAVIMAMGYNDLNRGREAMFGKLKGLGYSIETYVHPDARVYTAHPLGEGAVILPSAVVEPHVRVGANTFVWCNATLAHHSSIADHCWVASGSVISGQACVRRNAFIGVGAIVVNKVTVGEFNIIGGGALITKDTKASTVHLARSAELFRYAAEDYVKYFGF